MRRVWYMSSNRALGPARIAPEAALKYLYRDTYTVSKGLAYSATSTPV